MKNKHTGQILVLAIAGALLVGCGNQTEFSEKSVSDEDAISAEQETGLTTITVGGVEISHEDADNYEGELVTTTTSHLGMLSSLSFFDDFPYRTALYVKDGEVDKDNSVTTALNTDNYDDTELIGAEIYSLTDDFSGIIVNASDYVITDTEINMPTDSDGQLTNDFSGLGAALMNTNGGLLEIEDSTIATEGVAKLALITDNGANTIIRNSTLKAEGGTLYDGYYSNADQLMMVAPPWTLGMDDAVANSRTTNLMGDYSTETYIDCDVYAAGWGALSTDSDANYSTNQHLIAINTDVEVENSGYGAYVVTEGVADFYGTTMDVSTYGIIMTGGIATFESYEGGQEIDVVQYGEDSVWNSLYTFEDEDYPEEGGGIPEEDSGEIVAVVSSEDVAEGEEVSSVINSEEFGFMCHSNYVNSWNVVKLLDNTQVNTGDAVFLVKKANADFYVDDAGINSETGVLLQIIDNDDDYVGVDMTLEWGLDIPTLGRTIGTTSIDDYLAGNACHFPTFNEKIVEPAGWSYEWTEEDMATTNAGLNTTGNSGWEVNFTISNTELSGDIWNSSGYVTDNGGSALSVYLQEGGVLEGIISSGAFKHTIQEEEELYVEDSSIDAGGYYEALVGHAYAEENGGELSWINASLLGHVTNTQYYNGYNTVDVYLADDAKWIVTGTCYLNSLYIDENAQILASDGAELIMTIDGTQTEIIPGETYTGEIVLSIAS